MLRGKSLCRDKGELMTIDYKQNIETVMTNMEKAALKAGRNVGDVCLVAVTKRFDTDVIREGYTLGLRDFAENYAQEFRDKHLELHDSLGGDIKWHFIGKIQRNKVKYLVGKVELIHSLDSVKVAEAIDARSRKIGVETSVLVEVNISKDPNKSGIMEEGLEGILRATDAMANVRVEGLMCIAPYDEDAESSRAYFRRLRELRDEYAKIYPSLKRLSMGMTNDYTIAIEEGSTYVRIGRALFGPRRD